MIILSVEQTQLCERINTRKPARELCKRTYCHYMPGKEFKNVYCSFAWSGNMPCTGLYKCHMCGKEGNQNVP